MSENNYDHIWRTATYERINSSLYQDCIGYTLNPKKVLLDSTRKNRELHELTRDKIKRVQLRLFCWIKNNIPNSVIKIKKVLYLVDP